MVIQACIHYTVKLLFLHRIIIRTRPQFPYKFLEIEVLFGLFELKAIIFSGLHPVFNLLNSLIHSTTHPSYLRTT